MADDDLELEESETDAEGESEEASGGSGGSKTILIACGVALLLGVNGFVVYRLTQQDPQVEAAEAELDESETAEEGDAEPTLLESGAVLPLETLLVNLADEGVNRFVRARVELVFATQEEMEAVKESPFALAKAQHVALSLLATKHSSELGDLDGRAAFREELAQELSKNLKGAKVVDVLLTDFIIQY